MAQSQSLENGPGSFNELSQKTYHAQTAKMRCSRTSRRQRRRACRSVANPDVATIAVADTEADEAVDTVATERAIPSPTVATEEPHTDGQAPRDRCMEDPLVRALGSILEHMSSKSPESTSGSCFQCVSAPKVSITKYFTRIHKYFHCSDECFVIALAYIDRIVKNRADVPFAPLTCHRLLLATCVVAAKFHDDTYVSNDHYAKVGGIELEELNALEAELLQLLDWKLYVCPREYNAYLGVLFGVHQS